MITIVIYSHMTDRSYDFVIDEYTEVETVIDDVARMISQRGRNDFEGNISDMLLYSIKNSIVLNPKNTLRDYDIRTGDTLCMI